MATDLVNELEEVFARLLQNMADLICANRPVDEAEKWRVRAQNAIEQVKRANFILRRERDKRKPRFGSPRDYILMVLDQERRAMTKGEIVEKVLEAGFALQDGSVPSRKANIGRALSIYLTGVAGKREEVLRKIDGKVGRAEWPDSFFS